MNTRVRVGVDGMTLLPELGWVAVHGKERSVFERELAEQYDKLFATSRVRVVPAELLRVAEASR